MSRPAEIRNWVRRASDKLTFKLDDGLRFNCALRITADERQEAALRPWQTASLEP